MKVFAIIMLTLAGAVVQKQDTRLENIHGKTVLVFTPHPDDDVFGAGGTIAWRLLILSMRSVRRSSGCIFRISACSKACSRTEFPKRISSTLRRKKPIIT